MNDVPRSLSAGPRQAPAHVPAEMVRDYEVYYLGGSDKHTFSFLTGLHKDRDVFYNLNADPIICPNGSWYVTSFKLMNEVLKDAELFSSRDMVQYSRLIGESWDMIPLELDPPEHSRIRLVVMPMFSPQRMRLLTDRIAARAAALIDGFAADGRCEFIDRFANPLPVSIFLELLDLPFDRHHDFLRWASGIVHSFDPEERRRATQDIRSYLSDVVAERRANPGDDVISGIVAGVARGVPLTDDEITGLCFMIFIGGLDTVAATLGFTFRWLADNPEARARLRADAELRNTAVEEFVRAFSVVQAKRKLTRDVDFHGAPMKAGDYVTCVMGIADTDPDEFGDGAVQLDRQPNRHVGFGMGAHRCLGSHLARLELRVALEVWLDRIPEFSVEPGAQLTTHGAGGVYGYDQLPLVWPQA